MEIILDIQLDILHISNFENLAQIILDKVVAIHAHQFHVVKPCLPPVRIDV